MRNSNSALMQYRRKYANYNTANAMQQQQQPYPQQQMQQQQQQKKNEGNGLSPGGAMLGAATLGGMGALGAHGFQSGWGREWYSDKLDKHTNKLVADPNTSQDAYRRAGTADQRFRNATRNGWGSNGSAEKLMQRYKDHVEGTTARANGEYQRGIREWRASHPNATAAELNAERLRLGASRKATLAELDKLKGMGYGSGVKNVGRKTHMTGMGLGAAGGALLGSNLGTMLYGRNADPKDRWKRKTLNIIGGVGGAILGAYGGHRLTRGGLGIRTGTGKFIANKDINNIRF